MSKNHLYFNDGQKDSVSEYTQKLNNPFNNVLDIIPEQISNKSMDNSNNNSNSRNNLYNEESSFVPNPAFLPGATTIKYNIEKEIIDDKLDMNNSLLFDQNEYNKMISELNRDKNSHIFQEKINDKSSIFHEHEENTNEI